MSDISIPGVNSRFNTEKMIEDLMKVERKPLNRMENRVEEQQDNKQYWQTVQRYLNSFNDASKKLYGHQNPFAEREGISSNERVLDATVDRGVEPSVQEITVRQTAAADRFQSRSLSQEYKPPSGTYTFHVGDEEVSFDYSGDSLKGLMEKLNQRGRGVLRGSLIRNTVDTQVFVLSSERTGAENTLMMEGAAQKMALDTGILEESRGSSQDIPLAQDTIQASAADSAEGSTFTADGTTLTAEPGADLTIPASEPGEIKSSMMLEMEVRFRDREGPPAPEKPPGPTIPSPPGIDYKGLHLDSFGPEVDLPETKAPEPPPRTDTLQVLQATGTGTTAELPPLPDTSEFQTVQIPLGEYLRDFQALRVNNGNTHRAVEIRSPRLYDPSERGEYVPANPVSTARDAKIEMDGVPITRSSNSIDDLLDGVQLDLNQSSPEPVELRIEPNKKAIKDSIINFVGHYNQLLTEVNILTSDEEQIIQEVSYLSDDEREGARERLGAFKGDMTLNQIKTRLQRIMMNPYPTRLGRELSLLNQAGISTNASGTSEGYNASRLRGYLEIGEDKLDAALEEHPQAVKDLFGRDTDQDLLPDSGAAYEADTFLKPYLQTGGILATKFNRIDSQISRTEDEIRDYKDHLEDYQQELKQKYGQMEGAIQQLENQQLELDRLKNQSGQ